MAYIRQAVSLTSFKQVLEITDGVCGLSDQRQGLLRGMHLPYRRTSGTYLDVVCSGKYRRLAQGLVAGVTLRNPQGEANGGMGMQVVGVRIRRAGPPAPFRSDQPGVVPGARVVVEGERGLEIGSVVSVPEPVPTEEETSLPRVVRLAAAADLAREEGNQKLAAEAMRLGRERIAARGLEMQLIDTEVSLERQRILFYFTAPTRVDFRGLVRDLAALFRTRIDLRQIGVRDEAKLLGGIGPCGRMLCCASFLPDFAPVTIRMAKDQNLSLNPAKISGLCGRLACCLRFEWDGRDDGSKGGREPCCREKGSRL